MDCKYTIKEEEYGILISSPPSKEFSERLRAEIPIEEMEWRNDKKSWWISDAFAFEAEVIAREVFDE